MPHLPSIDELVAASARQWPQAEAVAWSGGASTYADLERRAGEIAQGLLERGVRPGDAVGVCLGVGLDRIAALLGVLKAGAAFVPLDSGWPAERVRYVVADAGVRRVLVDARKAPLLPELGERWNLDRDPPGPGARPLPPPDAERAAYVVYTSGSTGEPKGVRVPHRGVVNLCRHVASTAPLGPGARVHQFTPIVFDAAFEAVFSPLCAGATVVLAEEQAVSPAEFTGLVRAHRLTYLSLPPLFLKEWIAYLTALGQKVPETVRWVCLGGDRVPTELWAAWAAVGGARIPWANDYGPTETTITATRYEYRGEPLPQPYLPIGKPLPNVRAYVLSPEGREVEVGELGELFVGGIGVSHGYVGRPEATAEHFLSDPFAGEPNARMYRTGDLVRRLPGGDLEYVGRADDQVKISGYRVQLGEVEAALRGHPGIAGCAVVAREDPAGYKRLVAYVVAPGSLTDGALRERAAQKLPAYMVPSAIVRLAELPITANGKVDRKALPEPAWSAPARAAEQGDSVEARVFVICAELLGVEAVRAEDDFFELGGQSLLAMQLLTRVEEELGASVSIATLFEEPKLGRLAAHVVEQLALARAG